MSGTESVSCTVLLSCTPVEILGSTVDSDSIISRSLGSEIRSLSWKGPGRSSLTCRNRTIVYIIHLFSRSLFVSFYCLNVMFS
jgi:hypothetical protein